MQVLFDDQSQIIWLFLTAGNVDDRKGLRGMIENPFSSVIAKIYVDQGYISKVFFEELVRQHGIVLVTRLKPKLQTLLPMLAEDAFFLRKRAIAESIIDQLKNITQIEHSWHRSSANFVVNLVCGLIAYSPQERKPGLRFVSDELITA